MSDEDQADTDAEERPTGRLLSPEEIAAWEQAKAAGEGMWVDPPPQSA